MDIRDITFKKNIRILIYTEPCQGPVQTIPLFINSFLVILFIVRWTLSLFKSIDLIMRVIGRVRYFME